MEEEKKMSVFPDDYFAHPYSIDLFFDRADDYEDYDDIGILDDEDKTVLTCHYVIVVGNEENAKKITEFLAKRYDSVLCNEFSESKHDSLKDYATQQQYEVADYENEIVKAIKEAFPELDHDDYNVLYPNEFFVMFHEEYKN